MLNLGERFGQLDERERRLLSILLAVAGVFVLVGIPLGAMSLVGGARERVSSLRATVLALEEARDSLARKDDERDGALQRYANAAPPLAGFLERIAKESELEIPESQDRPDVPHGKDYTERSTKFSLRRVPLYNLVKFMERLEQSGHPVSVDKLELRKRSAAADEWDADVVISAYDRKLDAKKTAPAASNKPAGGPTEDDE